MQLTVIVGNPKPLSRTRTVAEALAARCVGAVTEPVDTTVIDLADLAGELFDWESAAVNAARDTVRTSDLVVVASPTFKATYTGLLKSFLDFYPERALTGVVGVPLMMGSTAAHSLAPDIGLRPLLTELGMVCPTRSLYVTEALLEDLDATLDAWAATEVPLLARMLAG